MSLASKYIASFLCLTALACTPIVPGARFEADFAKGTAAYDAGDFATARRYWKPLADNYDLAALRNMGHLYRLGLGVEKSPQKALSYYQRAANLGYAPAQFNLAMMYLKSDAIAYDGELGRKWLALSAAQNYPPAVSWQRLQDMALKPYEK